MYRGFILAPVQRGGRAAMAALQSKTMKTRALILLVCLEMTYPAHAAQCLRHFKPGDPVCSVGTPSSPAPGTFLSKVCDLKIPYDPSNLTPTYLSPACNGKTLAGPFLAQLASAFNLAPVDVKQKLCALNQVFVAPSVSFPSASGIWEMAPDTGSTTVSRRGNGGTYIAKIRNFACSRGNGALCEAFRSRRL
jgi:hypothetical protein